MTDAYSLKNFQIIYFDIVIGFSVNVKHMQISQQNWSHIQASGNQQIKQSLSSSSFFVSAEIIETFPLLKFTSW